MSNQWYNPAQISALLQPDEQTKMKTGTPDLTADVQTRAPNVITVSESGESTLEPDIAVVSISYKSTKETVEAVKHSVQRRIDYILQTLRNNGIKESQFNVHKLLERVESQFQMTVGINVEFHDFKICEDVCNFLVEKMDEHVVVSKPTFRHTQGKLDNVRRQACINAVKNARMKAEAIAQFVNQKLGSAIEIKEESSSEVVGAASTDQSMQGIGIKARIEASTTTVTVKISAKFEIEPKQKKKHN